MNHDDQIAEAAFFPRPDMPFGPEAPGVLEHLFDVEQGVRLRLRGFLAAPEHPDILFFHGNGETARDYDPLAEAYRELPASFWVGEYRGYGPCTGTPSVNTFLADAHETLDALLGLREARGHRGPLLVMGRSLGSAPAIELAASRACDLAGVIIESGFARIVPLLELMGVPARQRGVTEEWGPRNLAKMAKVNLPVLIIHAEQDQIIPIRDAELLHEAAGDPERDFLRVPRAGHNDIQLAAGLAYFERIAKLLRRISDEKTS